jgi:hypothetical protein
MGDFTIEGLHTIADQVDWDGLAATINSADDIDIATLNLEEAIRNCIDKVAPIKVIKFDHTHLGKWYTEDLKERVSERKAWQRCLRNQGYKAGGREKQEWRKERNKLKRDLRKATFVALETKVENALDAGKDMFGGVSDLLGWRSGEAPEMLSAKGSVTRDPEKMADILHKKTG